jgi:hypothetical protein
MNTQEWLAANGWSPQVYDLCWLDCPEPGYRKTWYSNEICLCAAHARVLESGRYGGSYKGAPLPPESAAVAWPWCPVERRLVAVV